MFVKHTTVPGKSDFCLKNISRLILGIKSAKSTPREAVIKKIDIHICRYVIFSNFSGSTATFQNNFFSVEIRKDSSSKLNLR